MRSNNRAFTGEEVPPTILQASALSMTEIRSFFVSFFSEIVNGSSTRNVPECILGTDRAAVTIDAAVRNVTGPVLWGLVPADSEITGDFSSANEWLPFLYPNIALARAAGINTQADRVSRHYAEFLEQMRLFGPMVQGVDIFDHEVRVVMNYAQSQQIMLQVDQYCDLDRYQTSHPPNLGLSPIGLHCGHDLTSTFVIMNDRGSWNMLTGYPAIPLSFKPFAWALMSAFSYFALLTGNLRIPAPEPGTRIAFTAGQNQSMEALLVEFAQVLQVLNWNSINVVTFQDALEWVPVFNKRFISNSLSSYCQTQLLNNSATLNEDLSKWLYLLYCFLRTVTIMKKHWAELNWIHPITFTYNVHNANVNIGPSREAVEACFNIRRRIMPVGVTALQPNEYRQCYSGVALWFPRSGMGTPTHFTFMRRVIAPYMSPTAMNYSAIVPAQGDVVDPVLLINDHSMATRPDFIRRGITFGVKVHPGRGFVGTGYDPNHPELNTDVLVIVLPKATSIPVNRLNAMGSRSIWQVFVPNLLYYGVPAYAIDSIVDEPIGPNGFMNRVTDFTRGYFCLEGIEARATKAKADAIEPADVYTDSSNINADDDVLHEVENIKNADNAEPNQDTVRLGRDGEPLESELTDMDDQVQSMEGLAESMGILTETDPRNAQPRKRKGGLPYVKQPALKADDIGEPSDSYAKKKRAPRKSKEQKTKEAEQKEEVAELKKEVAELKEQVEPATEPKKE